MYSNDNVNYIKSNNKLTRLSTNVKPLGLPVKNKKLAQMRCNRTRTICPSKNVEGSNEDKIRRQRRIK
jgi:hypothetical protein